MIVCLTVDADWCPPKVRRDCLELIESAGVPYTFFATVDQSPSDSPLAEDAWHPNFADNDPDSEMDRLVRAVPGAVGLRPHRLVFFEGLRRDFLKKRGVRWLSATSQPERHEAGELFGLPEIGVNWGDNFWFGKRLEPDFTRMASDRPGIFMANFHPVHVFMNTETPDRYAMARPFYHDCEGLRALRNGVKRGVRDVLADVLDLSGKPGVRFMAVTPALETLGWLAEVPAGIAPDEVREAAS